MSYAYGKSRWLRVKECLFVEDATSTIHTATFNIPAKFTVLDILVIPQVLWTATTSVTLAIGDANSATGWFSTVDLKATDLILGERLSAAGSTDYWGATNDTYLTTAGRFGQQTTNMIGGYCPTNYSIIATVTVVGPATTVGRTRVIVIYAKGTKVTPVLT